MFKYSIGFFFIALGLIGCGGNYSNSDIEFINALPVRSELSSKLPSNSTQQGVIGQQHDALMLGDPSPLYAGTKAASDTFNGGLFSLLTLIEAIRDITPTQRETNRRIWGPYPANDQPGFEFRVVMTRQSDTVYSYEVDFQRIVGGTWVTVISGTFQASGGVRKGTGEVQLFADAGRQAGLTTAGLDNVKTITATYATDRSPIEVAMVFVATDVLQPSVLYDYKEAVGRQGGMAFVLASALQVLAVTSRWLPDGRGRADVFVLVGIGFGLNQLECWDANFAVTYSNKNWDPTATIGAETSCPTLDPF